jgi:hypothetical protein
MITLSKGCSTCIPISTSTHWIQHYPPLLEKEIRWYQGYTGSSPGGSTNIRVSGEWKLSKDSR